MRRDAESTITVTAPLGHHEYMTVRPNGPRPLPGALRSVMVPIRQRRRLVEIATIMWASGLESIVDALGLGSCVSLRCRVVCAARGGSCPHRVPVHGSRPEQLVAVLERLGPTYVKLGQMLANRTDYVPEQYAEALRSLHSNVTPFAGALARAIVESELGRPLTQEFAAFDEEPFAAASLSQVHRARLLEGTEVAVKVQRPDAQRQVEADLELLGWLAARAQHRFGSSLGFRPVAAVEEFAKYTRRELDFRVEARVAQEVGARFVEDPAVVVPRVHRGLSSSRILTTDLVRGVVPTRRELLAESGLDPDVLLRTGARAMLTQIFDLGVFHADPHPGNILLLEGDRVCFLDFGLHGRIDRRERRRMAMLLYALGKGDHDTVADQLLHVSARSPDARVREFKEAAGELAGAWYAEGSTEFSVGRLLLGYLGVGARFGVEFPRDLLLLARSLVHLESTVSVIDPELSFAQLLAPLLPEIRRGMMPTGKEARELIDENWMDYVALLLELPERLPHLAGSLDGRPGSTPVASPPASFGLRDLVIGAASGALAAWLMQRRSGRR